MLVFLMYLSKKILKYNRLTRIKNNLISGSLSHCCKLIINIFHFMLFSSATLFIFSFFKSLDFEQNGSKILKFLVKK